MAIRLITVAGDPVLRKKANKVRTIDESIQTLIDDMIETMRDAPGVGLAANQVGVPLRVIVIEVPIIEEAEGEGEETDLDPGVEVEVRRELYTLVNPQIVKRSGERVVDEGCLSIPGYKAPTPRSVNVTAKGLDREGREIRIKAENNLLAEALEHEIDHLNGILYIDHLESVDQLVKLEEPGEADADEVEAQAGRS